MIINEVLASLQVGFPLLSALIWLPVLGIGLVALSPTPGLATRLATGVALLEFLLSLFMLSAFKTGTPDLQFVERLGFYVLGVDGVSALFLPLTALLLLMTCLSSEVSSMNGVRGYLMAQLGFAATMMGAFAAADLTLFWLFFALEIVPGYLLIARHGTGAERRGAAKHYLAVMVVSAGLLLIGLELLIAETGGARDLRSVLATSIPVEAQYSIFALLCVALGIKAPIFPLHSWLPKVLEQGPVVGLGIFLVGVKVGTYGLLRFVITVLPEASAEWFWLMAALGTLGMVYGGLIALAQADLRRLLAFASLSHMGVVLLGMFSLNLYGLQGGLLQMLSLGAASAGLYFIAGFLQQRVGPPDVTSLGGLTQQLPMLSLAFITIAMAAVGMPGTSGFNGEHLVVIGAYKVHWVMAICVVASTVLTAAYFLRFFLRAFMAEPSSPAIAALSDLGLRERVITLGMVGVVMLAGLNTGPFLRVVNSSLEPMAKHVETRVKEHALRMPGDALTAQMPTPPSAK